MRTFQDIMSDMKKEDLLCLLNRSFSFCRPFTSFRIEIYLIFDIFISIYHLHLHLYFILDILIWGGDIVLSGFLSVLITLSRTVFTLL